MKIMVEVQLLRLLLIVVARTMALSGRLSCPKVQPSFGAEEALSRVAAVASRGKTPRRPFEEAVLIPSYCVPTK